MPNHKHKRAIRERMEQTGESYQTARSRYLAERGLPADTPTSELAERRREAAIIEEYGPHLGIDLAAPVRGGPAIVVRQNGRVR
jgi:hypothetical protein